MKKYVAFLAACGSLALAAGSAAAHPVTFVGTLSTAGETVLSPPSAGRGTVTVVFDDDLFTMSVAVSFSGLSAPTTASHIHCCTTVPGVGTAGVATQVPTFSGFPLAATSGTYNQLFDLTLASNWNPAFITATGGTVASAFATFSAGLNSGEAYLNIHSSLALGGEIRAFLAPQAVTAVPEPATYAMMVMGLGVLGWAAKRRGRA